MGSQQDKAQLRQVLLQKRRSLSQQVWQEKSDRLCSYLQTMPCFQQAKTVLAYFCFRQEPDLSFLLTTDKRWGFPRCVGNSLLWHSWKPAERLQRGKYGIPEPYPDSPVIEPTVVDLILVPAVACDYQKYRLGYGGGFYDRLLASSEWSSKPTIGVVFDFAYLPQLPIDAWDKKLQGVCTETGSKD